MRQVHEDTEDGGKKTENEAAKQKKDQEKVAKRQRVKKTNEVRPKTVHEAILKDLYNDTSTADVAKGVATKECSTTKDEEIFKDLFGDDDQPPGQQETTLLEQMEIDLAEL